MARTGQGKRMCGWQTIQTVPYTGSVAKPGRENPAAHGGVTLRQTRVRAGEEVQGREVNANGVHVEIGPTYPVVSFRWGAKR